MRKQGVNIDKLFKQELAGADFLPPASVWDDIETELEQKKHRKLIFYRNLAAAMSLLLVVSSGIYFYNFRKAEDFYTKQLVQSNEIVKPKSEIGKKLIQEKPVEQNVQKTERTTETIKANSNKTVHKELVQQSGGSLFAQAYKSGNSFVIQDTSKAEQEDLSLEDVKLIKPVCEKLSAGLRKEKLHFSERHLFLVPYLPMEEEEDVIEDRWEVGARVTPVYAYRRTDNKTSDYQQSFNAQAKPNEKGMLALNGGLNLHFKMNRRLVIQTGINYSVMGQTIQNVDAIQPNPSLFYATDMKSTADNEIAVSNSLGKIRGNADFAMTNVAHKPKGAPSAEALNAQEVDKATGDIMQRLEYLELPVIARYSVKKNEKMELFFLGGASANFLVGNNVYFMMDEAKTNIGETADIANINYAGTLGMGFQFQLLDRLFMNFEPTFKYYLNPINKNSDLKTHPYSIGIYTGITYAF